MDGMRRLQSLSLKDSRVEQATSRDRADQVLCRDGSERLTGTEDAERCSGHGGGNSAAHAASAEVSRYVVELYTAEPTRARFNTVVAVGLNRHTTVASAVLHKMDRLLEPAFKAWARREAGGGAEFPADGSKLDVAYQVLAFKVLLLETNKQPTGEIASLFSGEALGGLVAIAIRPEELGDAEKHSKFKERFIAEHGDPFWGDGVVAHTLSPAVAVHVNFGLCEAQRVSCDELKEFLNRDENLVLTTNAIASGLYKEVDCELVPAPRFESRCHAPGRQERLDQIAAFVRTQRASQQDASLKSLLKALATVLQRLGALHGEKDRVSAPEVFPSVLGEVSGPVNCYLIFFAGHKDGRREGSSAAGAVIVWIGSSWAEKSVCWIGGYQPPQDPDAPAIGASTAGLLLGLGAAQRNGWQPLRVVGDHELIVNQHKTQFRSYDPILREFYDQVRSITDELQLGPAAWNLHPREHNRVAHTIAELSLEEEEPSLEAPGLTGAVVAAHLDWDVEYCRRANFYDEAPSHPVGTLRRTWPSS